MKLRETLYGSRTPSTDTIQTSLSPLMSPKLAATHLPSGLHAYVAASLQRGPRDFTTPFVPANDSLPLGSCHARRVPSGESEKRLRTSPSETSVCTLNFSFSHQPFDGSALRATRTSDPSPLSTT